MADTTGKLAAPWWYALTSDEVAQRLAVDIVQTDLDAAEVPRASMKHESGDQDQDAAPLVRAATGVVPTRPGDHGRIGA